MLDYEKVILKSHAYKMISKDIEMSRISHAYLFVSADENYLYKFAEKFAGMLININDSENAERNIMRVNKHIHPDVKFYGLGGGKIDVGVVSNICESAEVCAFEADKKVFVLLDANDMNEASQNKILKTIEEPPKNTFFILCATATSKILPTILSRVKQIDLDEISTAEIAEMLKLGGVGKENAEVYASCANFNASFAEKLACDDCFVDFFNNIVSCFFEINGSRDVLKYSCIFNAKNINVKEFFDIAMLISRDISLVISGKQELVVCKNVLTKLKVIASSLNFDATTVLIKTAIEAKKQLSFNANSTAIVDEFLFKLAEVKVKCRKS